MKIVVTAEGADHGARYVAELLEIEEARKEQDRIADILRRLPQLQEARAQARAERNFAMADAIRAEMESAGVVVSDQKINGGPLPPARRGEAP